MTAQKHFKELVRSRMAKTGERYASARRQVLEKAPTNRRFPWHFAGSLPATTALRVLLAHAGVQAPHTQEPFSEAMLFGIAGGIGIGVFSFFYEKEGFSSFFVAGRHLWHDDVAYLSGALGRLGLKPVIRETSGSKGALAALRSALSESGPCVAWVDAAHLPHRALPAMWSGGGYHVITVYQIDDTAATALIGDLTDEPTSISLADLATARARIKKQKNRLLALAKGPAKVDLDHLVREGLRACYGGLTGEGGFKNVRSNFSLESLRTWGQRLCGSKDKERWERVFAPGQGLWRGLVSIYDFIEHYGTGGGLCRPLFADFLAEAGKALRDSTLIGLSKRYGDLGRRWSELADAALADDVPLLKEAKELHAKKAELTNSGGSPDEIRAVWKRLGELETQARAQFPLADAEGAELRARLQSRVLELHEGEVAAQAALAELVR